MGGGAVLRKIYFSVHCHLLKIIGFLGIKGVLQQYYVFRRWKNTQYVTRNYDQPLEILLNQIIKGALSMVNTSEQLLHHLKANGADFFVSVPCKLLGNLINLLEKDETVTYMPVTREEEGLGVCAGGFLAGKTPVMVIQNTGIGTTISSLCSLGLYYQLPITMIISHRGSPGEKIGAQVPMGMAVRPLLETIGVPTFNFSDGSQVEQVAQLVDYARVAQKPVAALLDFDFWR